MDVQKVGANGYLVNQDLKATGQEVFRKLGHGALTVGITIRTDTDGPGGTNSRPLETAPTGHTNNRPVIEQFREYRRRHQCRQRTLDQKQPVRRTGQHLETLTTGIEAAAGYRDPRSPGRRPRESVRRPRDGLELHTGDNPVIQASETIEKQTGRPRRRHGPDRRIRRRSAWQPTYRRRQRARAPATPALAQIDSGRRALDRYPGRPDRADQTGHLERQSLAARIETRGVDDDDRIDRQSLDVQAPVVVGERLTVPATEENAVGNTVGCTSPTGILPLVGERAGAMPFTTHALPARSRSQRRKQAGPREEAHVPKCTAQIRHGQGWPLTPTSRSNRESGLFREFRASRKAPPDPGAGRG